MISEYISIVLPVVGPLVGVAIGAGMTGRAQRIAAEQSGRLAQKARLSSSVQEQYFVAADYAAEAVALISEWESGTPTQNGPQIYGETTPTMRFAELLSLLRVCTLRLGALGAESTYSALAAFTDSLALLDHLTDETGIVGPGVKDTIHKVRTLLRDLPKAAQVDIVPF